jgi:sulfate permease, SulP family
VMAGLVGSIVLMTNIVSFAALMFPGDLAAGASTAVWAMLVGSGFCGLWIAWRTSVPPLAVGMDSPTGAALVLLAAGSGSAVLAAGGSPHTAVLSAMLLFSAATLVTGGLLLGLGLARWGACLRFVPFFVVAGFLGATGWLLIAGSVRMSTGHTLLGLFAAWTWQHGAKLVCALGVLAVLLTLRSRVKSPLAIPLTLLAMTLCASAALHLLGLDDPALGWYLPTLGALVPWRPVAALQEAPMSLSMALAFAPDVVAVAIVALVSLVSKTASVEVARKTSGDLDCELRAHGVATLAVVPLGGLAGSIQLGTSRLLEHAGGATRGSGVACAVVLGVAGLASLDLPGLVPLPIAAGLVMLLGWGFLLEAFAKPLAQRDGLNLLLAVAIAAACVHFGYLTGVLGGVVAACLLFAVSYARVGVVRQQLSRTQFAGNVSRTAVATRHLNEQGDEIQLYWLSGYLFFGSSEGVFERVRGDIRARPPGRVSHVLLDFGGVTAADASAPASLRKLRDFCARQGVTLGVSAAPADIHRDLQRDGFFAGADAPRHFDELNLALAWAEDRVLAQAGIDQGERCDPAGFEHWLQQQLGPSVRAADFMAYLEQHRVDGGAVLCRQGEPSDSIYLVAAGRLTIDLDKPPGPPVRLRSINTQTVVGEMGFIRRVPRSATVASEGPATVFTLTRERFGQMRVERPDLASAFYECLLSTLADRMGLSERMVSALSR